MRILITNDDGIHAPGLAVLERIARQLSDDVTVVAPETDQSGVAHSLSLSDPLRLRKISDNHYAVKGTPTDCVIMGVRSILHGKRPDLILSGVNRGQNVAEDVSYSGTIAGAIEGTILGIPSVALSQQFGPDTAANPHWETVERHAPAVLRKVIDGIKPATLLNINFPDCMPDAVKGVSATVQGVRSAQLLRIDARVDGRGLPYYWIAFDRGQYTPGTGTDLEALAAKRISITPLRLDMTDHGALADLAGRLG